MLWLNVIQKKRLERKKKREVRKNEYKIMNSCYNATISYLSQERSLLNAKHDESLKGNVDYRGLFTTASVYRWYANAFKPKKVVLYI